MVIMTNYGKIHRFLLRTVASKGVLTMAEANSIISNFSNEQNNLSITDMVKEINEQIRPLQQEIKIANDELTTEQVLVFLSLGCDAATKSQGVFSANELKYFSILLEHIMTTESRQLTAIHAINLVSVMKTSFTKMDAQKILDLWCQLRYLDKDANNYALGIRTIHEFEGYFRENMSDTIQECTLCKKIVFRGYNCVACAQAVHTLCLNNYLKTIQKWPCCKYDFNQAQLDRLNSDSYRLTQSQLPDASQTSVNQDVTMDQTQEVDTTQEEHTSQHRRKRTRLE